MYTWVAPICSKCRVSSNRTHPWVSLNTECSPRDRMRRVYGFSVIDHEAIEALLLRLQQTGEMVSLDALVSGDTYLHVPD